jgi:DNA-directed RNA polymerase specialized sigma24 family protein
LRLQDYTPQEIGADLGLSAVALRVRLTRLRQRLRAVGVLDDWLSAAGGGKPHPY